MKSPIETAQLYFELSNSSDMNEIKKLLTESTTYSSQNTGIYLGVEDILDMQSAFHSSFSSLHWTINSCNEVKPGIVVFDYTFSGVKNNGEEIKSNGIEYVVVRNEKIIHIEIRNK